MITHKKRGATRKLHGVERVFVNVIKFTLIFVLIALGRSVVGDAPSMSFYVGMLTTWVIWVTYMFVIPEEWR